MRANRLNYVAAVVFFAAALRNWWFPGALQISPHPASSDEAAVWVVMGCTCIAAALARSRRAQRQRPPA